MLVDTVPEHGASGLEPCVAVLLPQVALALLFALLTLVLLLALMGLALPFALLMLLFSLLGCKLWISDVLRA